MLCILAQFAWLCTLLLDINCSHLIGKRSPYNSDARRKILIFSWIHCIHISNRGGIDGVQQGHSQFLLQLQTHV